MALVPLLCLSPANASTIKFDVDGTFTSPSGTSLVGTITIDVADGDITAADVAVPGFPDFTSGSVGGSGTGIVEIGLSNGIPDEALFIVVSIAAGGHTLVGYDGGTIFNGTVYSDILTGTVPDSGLTGSLTPAPLPAALPLFATGLGALGLFGWRRKRRNTAALSAA